MQITARADYAVRALVELASRAGASATRAEIAESQAIPSKFLESILTDLKKAGLLTARRGTTGGYVLAVAAERITIADVVRAVDGPLAAVRGIAPEAVQYTGTAEPLRDVWVAVRASVRLVLEATTVADLLANRLPDHVRTLLQGEGAYERR
ncbi:MAG TPA: Rrf2 family transcriptional regulator [Microbacterium sp.]|uniref:RrF2 family transcriptional regulator n=1 Tax=Microbacterium sp. TaxID=51671 RepID=UPI002B49332B|nr:Rrf2 family transcriptional regulator [Microbacterium sp.]HKT57435.1 Rrf2 family transcriptional regulator [Microbacterium sp.]